MFNNVNNTLSNEGYSLKKIEKQDLIAQTLLNHYTDCQIFPLELLESIFKIILSKQGIDYGFGNRITDLTGLYQILKNNLSKKYE